MCRGILFGGYMEIYTNSNNRNIVHTLGVEPTLATVTIVDANPDGTDITINSPVIDINTITFTLPYSLCHYDRTLQINYTFSYEENGSTIDYIETSYVHVITPIIELDTIRDILGDDATDDEVAKVERSTRYIIESVTVQ
jgi:hypothetical protein